MTKISNFTGLPSILLRMYVEFLFLSKSFSFFFSNNTTYPEVSYRENDYVERVSGINVELSYVRKALSV